MGCGHSNKNERSATSPACRPQLQPDHALRQRQPSRPSQGAHPAQAQQSFPAPPSSSIDPETTHRLIDRPVTQQHRQDENATVRQRRVLSQGAHPTQTSQTGQSAQAIQTVGPRSASSGSSEATRSSTSGSSRPREAAGPSTNQVGGSGMGAEPSKVAAGSSKRAIAESVKGAVAAGRTPARGGAGAAVPHRQGRRGLVGQMRPDAAAAGGQRRARGGAGAAVPHRQGRRGLVGQMGPDAAAAGGQRRARGGLEGLAHPNVMNTFAGSGNRGLQVGDNSGSITNHFHLTQHRKMQEEEEVKKCLKDLHLTDPADDKKRIEQTKGGLLEDSYQWILHNRGFRTWREDDRSRLLWIKGDPGKGKTMLLMGIINNLQQQMKPPNHLAQGDAILLTYFFCQDTDSRINNAAAVLRGLIYLLIVQQPSLVSHIQKKYDHVGKALFEDVNTWVTLSGIFTNILRDPRLKGACLIIDALDECVSGLEQLLDLIVQNSSASARVKWIVSSRNWPQIEERLRFTEQKVTLSLELNAASVSNAVKVYTRQKVLWLAHLKEYNNKTRDAVRDHLLSNSDDTFLWVALVCQRLEKIPPLNTLRMLKEFPPGLEPLYERMMEQVCQLEDVADFSLYKQILAVVTTVYQPVTLRELSCFIERLVDVSDDVEALQDIVERCGSFLTIRYGTIYFVHQSAKDYLIKKARPMIFPSGSEDIHHSIFSRSLQAMSKTLQRNIYSLPSPAFPTNDVNTPDPDPLAAVQYSCVHWVGHLCEGSANNGSSQNQNQRDLNDSGVVSIFLQRHFLHWLEALSLLQNMSEGVLSITRLESLLRAQASECSLLDFVQDAHRFILQNRWVIENAPLQAYASALIFSPHRSVIRETFKKEEPAWTKIKSRIENDWSPCLQTLEGHTNSVCSVAFSSDSKLVASGSYDKTIKIWKAATGKEVQTLRGHSDLVSSVAFSSDLKLVASGSRDKTIKIWEAATGKEVQTLRGHSRGVSSVAFSSDSKLVASGSDDKTIKIWEAAMGKEVQTLRGHSSGVSSVAFSSDSKLVASGSDDKTIKIWEAVTGKGFQTLRGHSGRVISIAISSDLKLIASGSCDKTIKIWEAATGKEVQTLRGHSRGVSSVAFSSDSKLVASGSDDKTIKIWEAAMGKEVQTLRGHNSWVSSVAFSSDLKLVASGSHDETIKIWKAATGKKFQTLRGHSDLVSSVAFSSDSKLVASGSYDKTIKIWEAATGKEVQTLRGHSDLVSSVAFSSDSKLVASGSYDKTIKIWKAAKGKKFQTLRGHSDWVSSVAFSSDSKLVASGSGDKTIKIWEAATGKEVQTLKVDTVIDHVSFNTNCSYVTTNIGPIGLNGVTTSCASAYAQASALSQVQHQGYGISFNGAWITWNENRVLWLPPDYRPSHSAVSSSMIAIGCHSGRIFLIGFSGPPV